MQMDAAIDKASALVEALGYIQRFHNKVVVVKVGGSIMDDEQALTNLLNDIVFMNYVGMQPVLVHGGGKAINDAMAKAGLEPQMVMGRRYTADDDRTGARVATGATVPSGRREPPHTTKVAEELRQETRRSRRSAANPTIDIEVLK